MSSFETGAQKTSAGGAEPEDSTRAFYLSAQAIEDCSVYRFEPQERWLIEKYFLPGEPVLDLACGAGRTTLRLHECGFPVVGIDLSEILIGVARRRFPYLDFHVGNFTRIEAPNASFSQVLISSNALDHAASEAERLTVLRQCARVLRPGGTLLYSIHNLKCLHLFSPRYWRRPIWKLRNVHKAFQAQASITEDSLHGLFVAPETAVRQTETCGFRFLEVLGTSMSANPVRNRYLSIFLYYAFRRLEAQAPGNSES